MQKPEGITTSTALDARLLRFRSRVTEDEACELADALMQAGRTPDALDVIAAGLSHFPDKADMIGGYFYKQLVF